MVGNTNDAKEYQRMYYLANRDKIRAHKHEWCLANRDNKAAYDREYYRTNYGGYLNGELNPDTPVGRGFIAEMIVAKALCLDNDARCNCTVNFGFKYDLLDTVGHGEINVKSAKLEAPNNKWGFTLRNKYVPDTYIFVAYAEDYKSIEHVWIIPTNEAIVSDKIGISVHNTSKSLSRMLKFEVDNTIYNIWLHTMSIDKCSILKKPDFTTEILQ